MSSANLNFLRLSVLELRTGAGQTDRQTDWLTDGQSAVRHAFVLRHRRHCCRGVLQHDYSQDSYCFKRRTNNASLNWCIYDGRYWQYRKLYRRRVPPAFARHRTLGSTLQLHSTKRFTCCLLRCWCWLSSTHSRRSGWRTMPELLYSDRRPLCCPLRPCT